LLDADGALQSPLAAKECRSREVAAGHGGRTFHISQCAGDAQHPMVAARRQSQPLGCASEQRAAAEIQ
jgi:hypothetical protein